MEHPTNKAFRRILLLIDDLECGGAQQLVVSFALELQRRGLHCVVCALHPREELKHRLVDEGVRVISLARPRESVRSPLRFIRYVFGCLSDLHRIIRQERIEVVHAHLSDAEFLGITIGLLDRVPCIVATVHSQRPLPVRSPHDPRTLLRVLLTRFLFNRANAIVAVSEETAAILREIFGVAASRLRVIINGIDLSTAVAPNPTATFAPPPGHPVLCAVGRLAPQKNHAALYPVLNQLRETGLDPCLLLLGDGPLRASLEEGSAAAGLTERVHFLGRRDDVGAVLAASDIFVMPSHFEGTSLALLEAMAAGKAIVASDVPGNQDILQDGKTALLCPADDTTAWVEAIRRLTEDPALATALGNAARDEAQQHYTIKGMTDAYIALWNDTAD